MFKLIRSTFGTSKTTHRASGIDLSETKSQHRRGHSDISFYKTPFSNMKSIEANWSMDAHDENKPSRCFFPWKSMNRETLALHAIWDILTILYLLITHAHWHCSTTAPYSMVGEKKPAWLITVALCHMKCIFVISLALPSPRASFINASDGNPKASQLKCTNLLLLPL